MSHDDVGGTTQDCLTLGHHPPGEPDTNRRIDNRETLNRRTGRIALTAGLCLIAGTTIAVGLTPEHTAAAVPTLVGETLITLGLCAGFTGVLLGGVERLTRYNRTLIRHTVAGQEETRQVILDHINKIGHVGERLTAIEHALDLVAKAIPDDQRLQGWRGFAAAARQGINEKTGTDNTGPRRAALGLVPRNEQPGN